MSRLIKKYKNRRLYDTELSQYITVEELEAYVVRGLLFHVEDATTEKDITSTVLLQILVEMEAGSTQLLSSEVLRQLISLAHHPMSKFVQGLMEQMIVNIQQQLPKTPSVDYQQFIDQWQQFFKK